MTTAARRGIALAVLVIARAVSADALDIIHVTANTGVSAGGHVAIRVADDAYHYQVDRDGLLFLYRDDWRDFVYRTAVLDNRSMNVVRVAPDEQTKAAIRSAFDRLYLTQAQDLFGDILDVKLKGVAHISYHLMARYTALRGLEEVMMDMALKQMQI